MHYRQIWIAANGNIPVDEKGRSYEIHHIDGNRRNNSLENLICLSIEDHYRIHLQQGDKAAAYRIGQRMKLDPEYLRELNRQKSLGKERSEEAIKKMIETRTKNGSYRQSAETRKKISNSKKGKSNGHEGLEHSEEWRKKQSESNKHKCKHVASGKIFSSVTEAAQAFNYPFSTFYLRFKNGEFIKIKK